MKDATIVITPRKGIFDLDLKEIWRYRDLLMLLVKRDIVVVYKQTILGPLWYIVQPLLTTLMFAFVFGKLAKISVDGAPHVLFYFLGVTIWGYFSDCLNKTSSTFITNQNVFGKVYFPRVVVPASIVISNLGKLIIQFVLFLGIWTYYISEGAISPNYESTLLLFFVVFVMAILSLGLGMIFSSMTTKYRDLTFLLTFGIQLWMYASAIIYPLSIVPKNYQNLLQWNPMVPLVESMRYAFLGSGTFTSFGLIYSLIVSIVMLFIGLIVFSKVQRTFMDTV